ncbi:MAG: hypothetical protein QOI66_5114, partial [Myxococcales bacterium]|nr:hypothetical protein [Myxococcales bacterium]
MAPCISKRRAGEVTGVIVLAIALSVGRSDDAAAQHAAAPSDGPDRQTFATVVAPFIKAHCATCHGPQKQKGDLRLDGIDADLARGKDAARWKEVSDRLNRGEMPPKGEPRPSAADMEKVVG